MIVVVQRVLESEVRVGDETVGRIGKGLLLLVGVEKGDTLEDARRVAEKVVKMRVFDDADGRMNLDVSSVGGSVLVVSQFTLAADISRGRRPSFDTAAPPETARELVDALVGVLREKGVNVETGKFGAHMHVGILNDGPVTFVVRSSGKGGDS